MSRENLARDHQSIRVSGIQDLEIYLLGTRMVMVMEVNEHFSFDAKARADQQNPKVQEVGRPDVEVSATIAPRHLRATNGY